jgi:hypothetical protein
MRTTRCSIALVTALMLAGVAHAQDATPVRLQPSVTLTQGEYLRLKSFADQGMTALRRYVWRTRMIYNYRIDELVGRSD